MTNFLEFIEEDIQAKKTLLGSMPTGTKVSIKKFNAKVDLIADKYEEYASSIKKYLDAKSKSFSIKSDKNTEKLALTVKSLDEVRFILNPINTYFEKMGFDTLFFQISNYHVFQYSSLNDIINAFLDKFELAGIQLHKSEFDFTCFVYEYMSAFLEIRTTGSQNYGRLSDIFERIYWVNPELINHIKLSFRRLIKKYERKFIEYISRTQKEKANEHLVDYEECIEKLTFAYADLKISERENISDIIDKATNGEFDINNFFEDSKVRTEAFNSLMIEPINMDDQKAMENFYEHLKNLKNNVEEYGNYNKFVPLIDDFKKEYFKDDKMIEKIDIAKELKSIESQITKEELKLDKINKKIFSVGNHLSAKKETNLKESKFESVKLASVINELYVKYEDAYFKEKVYEILNNTFTVSDLLELYYSYDYFKKMAIQRVFGLTSYDEILKYSVDFDTFATNPTNVIVNGICLTEQSNIARVIKNKYRLANINVNESDLNPEDLSAIVDKIDLVLRINEIEKSATSVEKIWFMTAVAKFNKPKNK